MKLNKCNYRNFPKNCPEFYLHDFTINKIIINNKEDQLIIEGREINKPKFITTTLIFYNFRYFEYLNFNPWSTSDGILNGIYAEDIDNYIEFIKQNRYFDFEKEGLASRVFPDLDQYFVIIIEMFSGDYIKLIVTEVELFNTEIDK